MLTRTTFITVGVLLGIATAAHAQTGMNSNPRPEAQYGGNFDVEGWGRAQTNRARAKPTKIELARAEQAADLIKADRCNDAYKLAVDAKDDRLARGVRRACPSPKS